MMCSKDTAPESLQKDKQRPGSWDAHPLSHELGRTPHLTLQLLISQGNEEELKSKLHSGENILTHQHPKAKQNTKRSVCIFSRVIVEKKTLEPNV